MVFIVCLRMKECVRMSELQNETCLLAKRCHAGLPNKGACFIRSSDHLTHSFIVRGIGKLILNMARDLK